MVGGGYNITVDLMRLHLRWQICSAPEKFLGQTLLCAVSYVLKIPVMRDVTLSVSVVPSILKDHSASKWYELHPARSHRIPEDLNLQQHHRQNLRSHIVTSSFLVSSLEFI